MLPRDAACAAHAPRALEPRGAPRLYSPNTRGAVALRPKRVPCAPRLPYSSSSFA